MPPAGSETGDRNSEINMQLGFWAKRDGTGKAFDSSAGLYPSQRRDAVSGRGLVAAVKMEGIDGGQKKKFARLCPTSSSSCDLPPIASKPCKRKCRSIATMARSWGLLIDPEERRFYVYRRGRRF